MLMTVTEKDNHLFIDWGELIVAGSLKFIDRNYWATMQFEKDSAGKITILNYNGFKGIKKK